MKEEPTLREKLTRRPWVGLTPEDVEELGGKHANLAGDISQLDWQAFAADLEARLKEKNQ